MPDVPEEAVRAAVAAYAREAYCDGEPIDGDERVIRCVLEAAAPALAEAVAQKILAHMEAHGPWAGLPLYGDARRTWRRHFSIAAQVASLAFSTEDDIKRLAAGALARGDFAACSVPELATPEDERTPE